MYYNVNLIAIMVASFGSLLLGWLWYSPKVFGTVYGKLQKHYREGEVQVMTKEQMTRGMVVMFFCGLLQAAVLYFLIMITRAGTLAQFMTIVFLVWAGFQLSGITVDTIWKGNSPKLIIIDAFFSLASNILMTFILLLLL